MSIAKEASLFAAEAHMGQSRKYTGEDYFTHVSRVAQAVAKHHKATEEMIAAAYLHDTVEDTPVTLDDIEEIFGLEIAELVDGLTNVSKQELPESNRAQRKYADLVRLGRMRPEVKIIKMFDRIDNLKDMLGASPSFKRLYAQESRDLAGVIGDADRDLKSKLLYWADVVEESAG